MILDKIILHFLRIVVSWNTGLTAHTSMSFIAYYKCSLTHSYFFEEHVDKGQ